MFCPKCGSNNKDDSSFCVKCGENLASHRESFSLDTSIQSNTSNLEKQDSKFSCPRCGTTSIQKISIVYSHGTSNLKKDSGSVGVGGVGGNLGVGVATTTTKGTQQTLLATQLAPPSEPKSPSFLAIAITGILIFFLFSEATNSAIIITIITIIAVIIMSIYFRHKYVKKYIQWESQKKEWERQWFCNRCGAIFEI